MEEKSSLKKYVCSGIVFLEECGGGGGAGRGRGRIIIICVQLANVIKYYVNL